MLLTQRPRYFFDFTIHILFSDMFYYILHGQFGVFVILDLVLFRGRGHVFQTAGNTSR